MPRPRKHGHRLGVAAAFMLTLVIGVVALPAAIITTAVLEAGQSDPVICPRSERVSMQEA